MKNKTTKFITKTLILLPVGILLGILAQKGDTDYLFFPLILGLMLSFGFIFWNVFDYEKYDKMDMSDFLESNHTLSLEYSLERWNSINDIIKVQFINSAPTTRTTNSLKIKIERKFFDSTLTIEKYQKDILFTIKRQGILSFLPDNAENYKTLLILAKRIKTIK